MTIFQVDVRVLERLTHRSKVDLVSSGYVSKFWAEPCSANLDGGLIILEDVQVHLAPEK